MSETPGSEAVRALRAMILAGERYRQALADQYGLGITETQAISYLAVNGDRGQSDLAGDLGITTSAATALVDRLEATEIASRYPHPSDRRRTLVRLTSKGHGIVDQSHIWLAGAFQRIPAGDVSQIADVLVMIAEDLRAVSAAIAADPEPLG